jgi:hypothetical protein
MIVEPNNQKVNFSFSGNLNYYIKSLKGASTTGLSLVRFPPPLQKINNSQLVRDFLFFVVTG